MTEQLGGGVLARHGRLAKAVGGLVSRWRQNTPLFEPRVPGWDRPRQHALPGQDPTERAILDVELATEDGRRWVDVTVRHPRASRYQPNASRTAGHAAATAEREKEARYPAAGGRSIWAVMHETWGRLGQQAEVLLDTCAAAARQAYRRGRNCTNILRVRRAKLDAALHRDVATQLCAAMSGLPGRPHRRAAPADRAELEGRCPL